jgi:4-amino-4-deoxy-L-arabinose transferase-like glycosyltransferase
MQVQKTGALYQTETQAGAARRRTMLSDHTRPTGSIEGADHRRTWIFLLLALTALTVYRSWIIVHNALPLYFDEAQYWVWSRTPDWGYYSKPPMVAWVIRAFSALGENELAVRAGSLLLHPLTAVLVYALGLRMFDARTAISAALLFISLPLVGFNSLFMTTDAPLFLFWGLATYALWNALDRNRWSDWLLVGIAAGLGLLSKYTMVIFAPSVALALCLPHYRLHWRNPRLYAAALLALIVFLPNLWWNVRMDFVSFRHTAEISQLGRDLFHPARLAEFIGGQLGCMGPISFVFLIGALAAPSVWRDRRLGLLAALTVPFLAAISVQALLAKANANWAAPAYFAGTLLVAARLVTNQQRRWWIAMIVLNLALLAGFYHYRSLADMLGTKLTRKTDPYSRLLGWPQAGRAVSEVLATHPDARLASLDRGEFALLNYYVRPHPGGMRIWNPKRQRQNHFHLAADMSQDLGANFIFATTHPMDDAAAWSFERWEKIGQVIVPLYPDYQLKLYLYRGDRFRGYRP